MRTQRKRLQLRDAVCICSLEERFQVEVHLSEHSRRTRSTGETALTRKRTNGGHVCARSSLSPSSGAIQQGRRQGGLRGQTDGVNTPRRLRTGRSG
eukprot:6615895-Prymnesium_polylepis.2